MVPSEGMRRGGGGGIRDPSASPQHPLGTPRHPQAPPSPSPAPEGCERPAGRCRPVFAWHLCSAGCQRSRRFSRRPEVGRCCGDKAGVNGSWEWVTIPVMFVCHRDGSLPAGWAVAWLPLLKALLQRGGELREKCCIGQLRAWAGL